MALSEPFSAIQPIRILIQQPSIAPYRLPVFRALVECPELVVTFLASSKELTHEVEDASSKIPCKTTGFFKFPGGLVWQKELVKEAATGNYDVISVGYDPHFLSSIAATLAAKSKRRGVVMWGHGLKGHPSAFKVALYRWLGKKADQLVFYSDEGASNAEKSGLPKDRTQVAWNSLDTALITSYRVLDDFSKRNRFVVLGRLIDRKKPALALGAFALAAGTGLPESIKLTFIGDGPLLPELKSLAAELGVQDRVEFFGAVYDEAHVSETLNNSIATLSPGYVGLNAIHSLAYGVPIIFAREESHSPEIAAVQEGKNSLGFPSGSKTDLAKVILELAFDTKKAESLGSAGADLVSTQFSTEAMVKSLLQAIQKAKLSHDRTRS